jgi:acyl carrier protein
VEFLPGISINAQWLDNMENEGMTGADAALPTDRLIKLVRQLLDPNVASIEPFPVDRQLSEIGLSSLKMVNLMLAVELEFDIMIPQAEITPENFYSVAAIAKLLERTLPPASPSGA